MASFERLARMRDPYYGLSMPLTLQIPQHPQDPTVPRSLLGVENPPPTAVASPTGMIHVISYTPAEGEQGVPITAHIDFHCNTADAVYVRLVVGNKAIATHVRELSVTSRGRWQLEAAVPSLETTTSPSSKVLLTVQALNDQNSILDSVTFGEFTYWESDCKCPIRCKSNKRLREEDSDDPKLETPRPIRRSVSPLKHRFDRLPTPPDVVQDNVTSTRPRHKKQSRRDKPQSLMRTRQSESFRNGFAQKATLQLLTPLDSVCQNWCDSDLKMGRRLVRFQREQHGHLLKVSCEPIEQEEYRTADIVISCIYRKETDRFFVTSVDIIYLLERLVDAQFEVEEKNRIRRNLEGLKPTTVSKNRSGLESFFQRIMDFPDPKPRNIEKDLKVFEWKLLPAALEKIISKYSLYSKLPSSTLAKAESVVDELVSEDTNLTVPKYESFSPVDVPFLSSISPDAAYYPLPDSPASQFPSPAQVSQLSGQMGAVRSTGSGSWGSEGGPPEWDLDVTFEVAEAPYADVGGFTLLPYDSVEFQTLRDHNLQPEGTQYL